MPEPRQTPLSVAPQNRGQSGATRPRGKPFAPGQSGSLSTRFQPGRSGNPGGRPQETTEWKDWCRRFAADNREAIKERALADNRFLAFIIEQGHGRAAQSIEAKVDMAVGLRAMSDKELEAAIQAELKQLHETSEAGD